ncbi:TraR/DksA family transcriptional regulator [Jatrophihabitans sp. DSM 45814]
MAKQAVAQVLAADRDATLARIASMTADLEAIAAAAVDSNLDDEHDPEGSTVAFEREQLAAVRAAAQAHLADIEAALVRLDAGRYGLCERCGENIAQERLALLPGARLCITCAARAKR